MDLADDTKQHTMSYTQQLHSYQGKKDTVKLRTATNQEKQILYVGGRLGRRDMSNGVFV